VSGVLFWTGAGSGLRDIVFGDSIIWRGWCPESEIR
jgi:hypothetical protein